MALHQQLACPVVVETIATAGAVGERWLGRDLDDDYLAVGDDVSGSLMVRGRPYRGSKGLAGALGHAAAMRQAGAPDPLAAIPQLFERRRAAGQYTTAEAITQRLEDGNELLLDWLGETATQLAPVLVALECLLDPPAFVLGGTLPSPLTDALLEHLVTRTKELRVPAHASAPEFLRGMTGDEAIAIGAATLPLYQALSSGAPTSDPAFY